MTATLATLAAGLGVATAILALLLRAARREIGHLTVVARMRGEAHDRALTRVLEIQGRAREERDRYEIALADTRIAAREMTEAIDAAILGCGDPESTRRLAHERLRAVLSAATVSPDRGGGGAAPVQPPAGATES